MPKTGPVEERTRAQLQRLKWGMMFVSLLLLAPYEVYNLLVVKIEWQGALLDTFVVLVASLTLVQVSFSVIFRLYAGELLAIKDTAARPSVFSAENPARGIKAAAGIPLLRGDQVLGVLSIGFGGPHTFTEDELETLRLLGNRAAVALGNARQYQRAGAEIAAILGQALEEPGRVLGGALVRQWGG